MPVIDCKNRAGLSLETKARLAEEITTVVRDVIKSPTDLISVTFADFPAESTYRSGQPTDDTLIFCHIRKGRSDEAINRLLAAVSATWAKITDTSEDKIELTVAEYPAKFTLRGGVPLPEPPIV